MKNKIGIKKMQEKSRIGYIIMLLVFILIINLSSASLLYKQNQITDIKIPCVIDGSPCSASATCKINIQYTNTSYILSDESMTYNVGGDFNYTYNFTESGTYPSKVSCSDAGLNGTSIFDIEITPSGKTLSIAQSGISIGILISIIFLMFFFGWLSFKFLETDSTFPIGIFFLLISIIISLYGMYLGVIYSQDFLLSATSNVQSKIFIGIMYGMVGMMFLGLLMLILMALREFKERKSIQRYGSGYNTQTKQYE